MCMATSHHHFPLLFFFSFLFSIILYLLFKPKHGKIAHVNGLRAFPIVGHLPALVANHHRFMDWMTEALAAAPTNTVTLCRIGSPAVFTANPIVVEHLLKTNFNHYPKGPKFTYHLQDLLGRGIFNADGELWRAQRKIASFEFSTRSLRNFVVNTVQHDISSLLLLFVSKSRTNGVIDLQDVFERFAFDIVCKLAFGVEPACLVAQEDNNNTNFATSFAEAFDKAANISAERFHYAIPLFWKIKRFLNIGSERQLKESVEIVHNFAMQIIRSKKKQREASLISSLDQDDLLSRFIAAFGSKSDNQFLRDIVISFILAGRDTTSSALTWFFWLLSSRPEVESKILREVKEVRRHQVRESLCFDFEELREMHYLHAAITEAMRLYPPVPLSCGECVEDEILPDGTTIRKGWHAAYNAYSMGRMENIWGRDCCDYKPERWLVDGAGDSGTAVMFKPENQYKFPVFHAGPRMCLGKEMAYIQMKSIAACILERFSVELAEGSECGQPPEQMISLTLRMKNGLQVRVRQRPAAVCV